MSTSPKEAKITQLPLQTAWLITITVSEGPESGNTSERRTGPAPPKPVLSLGVGSLEDIRFHLPLIYVTINMSPHFSYGNIFYTTNL